LGKFSLERGVFDSFQIRIDPGVLPKGSLYVAESRAKDYHKYPLPGSKHVEGCCDYIEIMEEIIKFLSPFDQIPILFAKDSDQADQNALRNTERAMKKIFDEAGEYVVADELKVLSLFEFFYQLQLATEIEKSEVDEKYKPKYFQSRYSAIDSFNLYESKFHFIYIKSCEFHYEKDVVQHCCLSKIHHIAFTLAHFCSDPTKYGLIENQHFHKLTS
jgi:hypothetical protein